MARHLLLLSLLLLAAQCAPGTGQPGTVSWDKPGFKYAQFDVDQSECGKEWGTPYRLGDRGRVAEVNARMSFNKCMEAKGYLQVSRDPAPTIRLGTIFWNKPGFTSEEFRVDRDACRSASPLVADAVDKRNLFNRCMESKGYHQVPPDQAPPQEGG